MLKDVMQKYEKKKIIFENHISKITKDNPDLKIKLYYESGHIVFLISIRTI
jgi:hypothetical protein